MTRRSTSGYATPLRLAVAWAAPMAASRWCTSASGGGVRGSTARPASPRAAPICGPFRNGGAAAADLAGRGDEQRAVDVEQDTANACERTEAWRAALLGGAPVAVPAVVPDAE